MFPVFHLVWSTCRTAKTIVAGWRKLLQKVECGSTLSNKIWLCCLFFIKLTACRTTNLLVPWQINQSACRISSCGSSSSRKVKNGKHQWKLATEQCCVTSWGFLYLVFHRLKFTIPFTCHVDNLLILNQKLGFIGKEEEKCLILYLADPCYLYW